MIENDMNVKQTEKEKELAHTRTRADLLGEIDRHDVISFDIFDTLLVRKVLVAEDVFDLVSARAAKEGMKLRNFREMRVKAQTGTGLINPDIYEIYDSYQRLSGIVDVVKERLIQLELEVECDVLMPRKSMLEIFQYALDQRKEVYLVSDMYLSQKVLQPILRRFQIGWYKELFISCDYKQLKQEGLFENLVAKERGRSILHIGDHAVYDGICAKKAGIDTFLVCTPWELMQRSSWAEYLKKKPDYVNDRSLLGLSLSYMFNDPFVLNQETTPSLKDCNQMGFVLFAPIVTVFMVWLLNQVKNKGFESVLFAARDGFLIQRLYDRAVEVLKWYDMPKSIYFQTSRKATVTTDMANEAMINTLIGIRGVLSPEEVLKQLFGLDEDCIQPFPEGKDWDLEIYSYVWKHKEQIFKKSANMRRNYFRYMGNLGLKIGKKYAFYDFVSSGTSQKALNKMVPFEMYGYYFGWNSQENKKEFSIDSLFGLENNFFIHFFKVLELFMTSDKPSLDGIDDGGLPILAKEFRTEEEIGRVYAIQNSITAYFAEFMEQLFIPDEEMDAKWADRLLNCIVKTDISGIGFDLYNLRLTDDWNRASKSLGEIIG